MAFAGVGVDFVPPSQANEPTSSDVFEVVEVDGEEDECEYEDEDAVRRAERLVEQQSWWGG